MAELLEEIKKKDKNAVSALYNRYGKKLYGYAVFRWQVSEDEAWELIYKTLYKFLEVVDRYTFENETRLQSFLFQSFINNLRNQYNEKKSKQLNFVPLEEYSMNKKYDSPGGEEDADEKNPQMDCLKKILDQLDDWKRILLLMRAQDYAYEDIASYVSKPAGQLKVYYMRAKKLLVEKVNDCVKNS